MAWPRRIGPDTVRGARIAALVLIAALATGLYLPFVRNPLVFDDWVVFSGGMFSYYATHVLGLVQRTPAYFTLAFTEVIAGTILVHRIVSLALHVACALALFRLTYDLLIAAGTSEGSVRTAQSEWSATAASLFAAAAFAVHPVAVYGAGYLVERTIVLATLFALLSLTVLLRGLERRAYADAVSAGFLYSLAVLSKEHSILLPAIAVPLALLVNAGSRFALRYVSLYMAVCAPAALFVLMLAKQIIGTSYEPHLAGVARQMAARAGEGSVDLSLAASMVTQAGLFFRYLAIWIWPDTGGMAIDLRLDPFADWTPAWIGLKAAGFAAVGLGGVVLALRRGRPGMVGLGVLYVWILFLVEMSVSRFQEPFVLYRSYLWAPGIALALAAVLDVMGHRIALAAFALSCPILLYQAHDRLTTFSSPLRLWEDAAAKLPVGAVPWGSRVLYNLAGEYLYAGQPGRAIATAERCLAIYPDAQHCVFSRGAIHLQLGEYESALPYLLRAAEIDPKNGITQHRIGLALEKLGRIDEARQRYRKAFALGYRGGEMELDRLDATGAAADPAGRAKPGG